jgi:hypothetical protein
VSAFGEFLSFYAKKKVTPEFRCARRGRHKKGTLRKCSPAMAGQGSQRTTVFTIEGLIHHYNNFYLNVQSLQLVV